MADAEILIGTYEDYVVGYRVEIIDGGKAKKKLKTNGNHSNNAITINDGSVSLEQSFALRGHSGSVRCLVANQGGSLALSGGFDEMINLVSLKKRKLLQTSEGAFNSALFVGNSHLIGGSEDSNIYVYECKQSQMTLVKTLKGHKEAVVSLHAHPSGKVLLSLSKDNTIKTWNLIKGRCAYTTNIGTPQAHLIRWTKTGDGFMLTTNNEINLYDNESGLLQHTFKLDKRINSIEFISDNVFVVASDSGKLEFYNLKEGTLLKKLDAHETRIKSVRLLSSASSTSSQEEDIMFVTASSDGVIKLWRLNDDKDIDNIQELTRTETGTRLTCMTTANRAL